MARLWEGERMTLDLKALKREVRRSGVKPTRLLEIAALDPQLSRFVGSVPSAPAAVLATLSRSTDIPTRRAVASNPVAYAAILDDLARDHSLQVLKAVAMNPNTSSDTIDALVNHSQPTVRAATLRYSPRPPGLLERLTNDPHPGVRMEVAGDAYLTPAQLLVFLSDSNPKVRERALINGNCDDAHRVNALRDNDTQVRFSALNFLSLGRKGSLGLARKTGRSKNYLTLQVIGALSRDENAHVRARFAYYLRTGEYDNDIKPSEKIEIARRLCSDTSADARTQAQAILEGAHP